MENLQNLLRTALIGTGRGEFVPATQDLAVSNTPEGLTAEEKVLHLSLLYSRIRRTGFKPAVLKNHSLQKAEKETLKSCSDTSSYHFLKIVESKSRVGMKVFLQLLEQTGRHIPIALLPEILDVGKREKNWNELIINTMGNRGHWLVKQNPDWQYLELEVGEDAWEIGTRAERAVWLKRKRKQDATFALENLLDTWDTDSYEDRIAFLPILDINLSENDQEFLEKCLSNRRKEVRSAALSLLYKLKTSTVSLRMQERLKVAIVLDKKIPKRRRLDVTLPSSLDKSMKEDGITETDKGSKGGKKAHWLRQMVGIVAPSFWNDQFGLKTDRIILLFYDSDWKEVLLNGLINAALRHEDKEYLRQLLEFWVQNINDTNLKAVKFNQLFGFLTEPVFQKIAITALKKEHNILDENNSVTQLLLKSTNAWSDELSLEVFSQFNKWLESTSQYWMGNHFKSILKVAAYSVNPKLHSRLDKSWPQSSSVWSRFESEVQQFMDTLKLREQIIAEFNKE